MDFFIGPAVGAEYFFSEQFSMGMEVQLNYINVGEWDNDYGGDDGDVYYLSNRTHLFFRFYFGTYRPNEVADRAAPPITVKPQPAATPPTTKTSKKPIQKPVKTQSVDTTPGTEQVRQPTQKPTQTQPDATLPTAEEGKQPTQKSKENQR